MDMTSDNSINSENHEHPLPMEEYLFDLHGYTLIKKALDKEHIRAMNDWLNALPPLDVDQWYGPIDVQSYGGIDGVNLQNIIEAGELFERLIDHPSWIGRIRYYTGNRYQPMINEAFINLRESGGYIGVHSGGHVPDFRINSGRSGGEWCCSYLTLLVALNDVGPGDGATVVIPSSHKADFPHPMQSDNAGISKGPGDKIEGAVEIHCNAGDALLLNDYACHGSAARTNPGERRMVIFRYLPSPFAQRFGHVPSEDFLNRLTPERRALVQLGPPRRPSSEMTP